MLYSPMVEGQIRQLIEAKPFELLEYSMRSELPLELRQYALVTARYLEGDLERLAAEIQTLENSVQQHTETWPQNLLALAALRQAIRTKKLSEKNLVELEQQPMLSSLEGEKYFLLGLAWENRKQDKNAMRMFEQSYQHFQKNHCPQKALRALYNRVAAESRVWPYKNFVLDCQSIIEYSKQLNEPRLAAMSTIMLSREYQVLRHFNQALAMADEAVEALQEEKGLLHYHHAVLHKAHILLNMNRLAEAKKLILETELSYLPEIQSARQLLLHALGEENSWEDGLFHQLMPTWKERVAELAPVTEDKTANGTVPTYMEERLLKTIWRNPKNKWDLIATLYNDTENSEVLENRFKNLVARVRKKYPNALLCKGSTYFLNSHEMQNLGGPYDPL